MNLMKDTVRALLVEHPHLRDDDHKLIATVWLKEFSDVYNRGAMDFLQAFASKQLSNPESIRRSRQKLQQENKHLRGHTWEARHGEAERFKNEEILTPKL
jgi:hypothetical protein